MKEGNENGDFLTFTPLKEVVTSIIKEKENDESSKPSSKKLFPNSIKNWKKYVETRWPNYLFLMKPDQSIKEFAEEQFRIENAWFAGYWKSGCRPFPEKVYVRPLDMNDQYVAVATTLETDVSAENMSKTVNETRQQETELEERDSKQISFIEWFPLIRNSDEEIKRIKAEILRAENEMDYWEREIINRKSESETPKTVKDAIESTEDKTIELLRSKIDEAKEYIENSKKRLDEVSVHRKNQIAAKKYDDLFLTSKNSVESRINMMKKTIDATIKKIYGGNKTAFDDLYIQRIRLNFLNIRLFALLKKEAVSEPVEQLDESEAAVETEGNKQLELIAKKKLDQYMKRNDQQNLTYVTLPTKKLDETFCKNKKRDRAHVTGIMSSVNSPTSICERKNPYGRINLEKMKNYSKCKIKSGICILQFSSSNPHWISTNLKVEAPFVVHLYDHFLFLLTKTRLSVHRLPFCKNAIEVYDIWSADGGLQQIGAVRANEKWIFILHDDNYITALSRNQDRAVQFRMNAVSIETLQSNILPDLQNRDSCLWVSTNNGLVHVICIEKAPRCILTFQPDKDDVIIHSIFSFGRRVYFCSRDSVFVFNLYKDSLLPVTQLLLPGIICLHEHGNVLVLFRENHDILFIDVAAGFKLQTLDPGSKKSSRVSQHYICRSIYSDAKHVYALYQNGVMCNIDLKEQ